MCKRLKSGRQNEKAAHLARLANKRCSERHRFRAGPGVRRRRWIEVRVMAAVFLGSIGGEVNGHAGALATSSKPAPRQ
jgi:hypothetical protein